MKSKITWGIFLIVVAVCLLLSNMGYISLGVFTVIWGLVFLAILAHSLCDANFTLMALAITHLLVLFRSQLALPDKLSSWLLILAGTLIGVGLDAIFYSTKKKLRKKFKINKFRKNGIYFEFTNDDDKNDEDEDERVIYDAEFKDDAEESDGEPAEEKGRKKGKGDDSGLIYVRNSFGEVNKYVSSPNLREAEIKNSFGQTNVYFDSAAMKDGKAFVTAENSFGEIDLYFPSSWALNLSQNASLGAVEVSGNPSKDPDAPVVYVNAESSFGAIDIHFQ